MATSLVVTVIGPDRPGLVSLIAECGKAHGASWVESRMASLAGQFAGIVRFAVARGSADALTKALVALEGSGLRVVIAAGTSAGPPVAGHAVRLELVGLDRPGIIRDISRALAAARVSIDELDTEVVSGAMSGEAMFQAKALLHLPADVATDQLRALLEGIANELMVDIALADRPSN